MNPSIHTKYKMFYNNVKCLSISLLNDKKWFDCADQLNVYISIGRSLDIEQSTVWQYTVPIWLTKQSKNNLLLTNQQFQVIQQRNMILWIGWNKNILIV